MSDREKVIDMLSGADVEFDAGDQHDVDVSVGDLIVRFHFQAGYQSLSRISVLPTEAAVREALDVLDGSKLRAVQLLTGFTPGEIERLSGLPS